jgi:hypothetical protein
MAAAGAELQAEWLHWACSNDINWLQRFLNCTETPLKLISLDELALRIWNNKLLRTACLHLAESAFVKDIKDRTSHRVTSFYPLEGFTFKDIMQRSLDLFCDISLLTSKANATKAANP